MARVTVRLPEDLHCRLRAAAERTRTSLNQLIITTLSDALARDAAASQAVDPLFEQAQHVRRALGDLAIELDLNHLPPHLRPREDLPSSDALRRSMPQLVPPLSATIIADRDDHV